MNKKVIVSTLALAMGAALAGSVSGTVAWFQYSTRAQAAFIGTTAHCSEALEIQATEVGGAPTDANWKTELESSDIATACGETGTNLSPITTGALAKDAALPTSGDPATLTMYANPIYQHFALNEWEKATSINYAQFDLHFRVKDVDGADTVTYLAKNLYLTDLSIVSLKDKDPSGYEEDTESDLYKAIRVHLACGTSYKLFANDGSTNAEVTTSVSEKLDLNNDGKLDTSVGYSEWETVEETAYGTTGNQVAYNVGGTNVFAVDTDPANITANQGLLGETTTSGDMLKVTVTMWIEGWQKFEKPEAGNYDEDPNADGDASDKQDSAVWSASDYIGKKFGVGLRFAVPAHAASDHE